MRGALGEARWATVEEVTPGELLSFWWPADGARATLVEVTLTEANAGAATRVVVESGYAGQPACGSPWARVGAERRRVPPLARLHDSLDLVVA